MGYPNGKSLQLLFFEKYNILAVCVNNAGKHKMLGRHILRTTASIAKPHRIYLDDQTGDLNIEQVNGAPAGSKVFEFCFTGRTVGIIKDEGAIVIGTGDIRNGISDIALTRIDIPLSTTISDNLIVSCTADFKLKFELTNIAIQNPPNPTTCP